MGSRPKKTRRERGDGGISWDKTNKCYIGTLSLGYDSDGNRIRPTVRGKDRDQVKDDLDKLRNEIKAGIRTPATYTVEQCVKDWLEDLTLDPDTIGTYRGFAEKWIYPRLGTIKLKDLTATDVDAFFKHIAKHLGKASLLKIKGTLTRSIRRAQRFDLIGRNVAQLVDLPPGQPGRPSRAMSQEQAAVVLRTASGKAAKYIKVIKISAGRYGAIHAATEDGELACGTKPRKERIVTEIGTDLEAVTCRYCQAVIGQDEDPRRLEALLTVALTLGLRPGELRTLTWDHIDLDRGVVHVWRSARRDGDTKTPKSKRSLQLPKRAIIALEAHKARQDEEREQAGALWQENNLVFCHEDGSMYSRWALNYRFGKMAERAGIGHWHAHEGRHTAVSIMSHNGVPIQEISDTMGHKSTHVTETVYRHVIAPAIRGGATVMDDVFGDGDAA